MNGAVPVASRFINMLESSTTVSQTMKTEAIPLKLRLGHSGIKKINLYFFCVRGDDCISRKLIGY